MAMKREIASLINDRETVAALDRHFRKVLDQIKRRIASGITGVGIQQVEATIREINRLMISLDPANAGFVKNWIKKNITKASVLGERATSRELRKIFTKALSDKKIVSGFGLVNQTSMQAVIETMEARFTGKTAQMRELLGTTIRDTQVSLLRSKQISDAVKNGIIRGKTGQAVRDDITAILLGDGKIPPAVRRRLAAVGFRPENFDALQAVAGDTIIQVGQRRMSIATYASQTARTQLREAHKVATIARLQGNGVDHVKVSRHPQKEFDECTPWAGQVFYIGPLDVDPAGFPKLSTITNGGVPFHPNCLHVITPWVVDFQTADAVETAKTKIDTVPRRFFGKNASGVRKRVGDLSPSELERLFPDGFEDVAAAA